MKTKMMMFAAAATMMSSAGIAQTMWNNGAWSPTSVSNEYPACSGAENDDRCIQLYERGMRTNANLAMNEGMADDMGGQTMLSQNDPSMTIPADGNYTGQGGPYEDVDPADLAAMSGVANHAAQTNYSPCPRSDAADTCIQLYERGVTGDVN